MIAIIFLLLYFIKYSILFGWLFLFFLHLCISIIIIDVYMFRFFLLLVWFFWWIAMEIVYNLLIVINIWLNLFKLYQLKLLIHRILIRVLLLIIVVIFLLLLRVMRWWWWHWLLVLVLLLRWHVWLIVDGYGIRIFVCLYDYVILQIFCMIFG